MSAAATTPSLEPPAWPEWWQACPPLRQKSTAAGPCLFREVGLMMHDEIRFRDWWKKNAAAMIRTGWGISSYGNQTRLQQWLTASGDLTAIGRERVARLDAKRAAAAQAALPLPPEPELILPALPGELESKLRPYQVTPARQLFRALNQGREEWGYPGALDTSDMGTGKTYMDLAAALATGRKIIVLCPVVGKGGWERAFQHFGAEPHFIGTYEGLRSGNRPRVVAQDEAGEFRWQDAGEIILILDEAQALRHDDTLNVKLCSAAIRQGIPILVASATLAIDPREFRFAGRIVGLHDGAEDWTRFLLRHGCTKAKGATTWKWDGDLSALARINSRLFPRRGCRVRKQDLGDDCPETEINVLPIRCEAGDRIAALWRDTERHLERLRGTRHYEMEFRRCRMKIWQASEMALAEPIAARIRQDVRDGRSVAAFVSFTGTRMAIARILKTNAGFYGGQPLARRQYFERQFQENREHILVNQIGAGGASVSLHDTTGDRPRSAYIFPTDNPVHMRQATGRVDRVGGMTKSMQWIPCVAGTISERMVERARKKMLGFDTLNDGTDARQQF